MAIETTAWDPAGSLTAQEARDDYLKACLADAQEDNSPSLFAAALGDVARAIGMSDVAKNAGLTREALYKSLTEKGDPKLSTILSVMKALGYTLDLCSSRDKVVEVKAPTQTKKRIPKSVTPRSAVPIPRPKTKRKSVPA